MQMPNKRNKQRMSHNTKLKIGIDKKAIAKRKYLRHQRGEFSRKISLLLHKQPETATLPLSIAGVPGEKP